MLINWVAISRVITVLFIFVVCLSLGNTSQTFPLVYFNFYIYLLYKYKKRKEKKIDRSKENLKKKVVFGSGGLFSKKDILKMSKNQKGLLK